MKITRILLGALFILGGFVCLADPFGTQLTYAYVTAVYAGILGILGIIDYVLNRKDRSHSAPEAAAGGFFLLVSILSVVFMLCNLTIPGFTFASEYFGALLLVSVVLVHGIMTVLAAFLYRGFSFWLRLVTVIFGCLMVSAASMAFWFIPAVIGMLGVFTSVGIISAGVTLLLTAFSWNKA